MARKHPGTAPDRAGDSPESINKIRPYEKNALPDWGRAFLFSGGGGPYCTLMVRTALAVIAPRLSSASSFQK
jgi:hypothetical protein